MHLISPSGEHLCSTIWSLEQDAQGMHLEESSYLENETPALHGTQTTMVLKGNSSELPHSFERPCPGGQVPQFIHRCDPSSSSTQCWVGLQGLG